MSTMELPKSSKALVFVAAIAIVVAGLRLVFHPEASLLLLAAAFFLSGFLADAFTGLAHFGFDYVFPYQMPILGPISREFREHHDCPTLDPSNYIENLTKGSWFGLPISIAVFFLTAPSSSGPLYFLFVASLFGMGAWAFFFHQIHSYAHMGSILPPEELNACVLRIRTLPSKAEQVSEFFKLFQAVPIPPVIRTLQRLRIILNPATHNLHHVLFESDFSSVNGWSDPFLNPILGPIARRKKAAMEASAVAGATSSD